MVRAGKFPRFNSDADSCKSTQQSNTSTSPTSSPFSQLFLVDSITVLHVCSVLGDVFHLFGFFPTLAPHHQQQLYCATGRVTTLTIPGQRSRLQAHAHSCRSRDLEGLSPRAPLSTVLSKLSARIHLQYRSGRQNAPSSTNQSLLRLGAAELSISLPALSAQLESLLQQSRSAVLHPVAHTGSRRQPAGQHGHPQTSGSSFPGACRPCPLQSVARPSISSSKLAAWIHYLRRWTTGVPFATNSSRRGAQLRRLLQKEPPPLVAVSQLGHRSRSRFSDAVGDLQCLTFGLHLSQFAQNQQAFFDSSHGNTLVMCSRPIVPHIRSFVKGIFEPSDRGPLLSQLRHQQTKRATPVQTLLGTTPVRFRELGFCSGRSPKHVIVSWMACSFSTLSGTGFIRLCSSP